MNKLPSPFPWHTLEALSQADVDAAARLRRIARAHVDVEGVAASLTELVGEKVEILVRRVKRADAHRGADDAVGVMFARSDAREIQRRILVELEGTLATTLTAKALKQRAPRITDTSRPASPAVAGATAAVVHAALRRAHARASLRIVAAGPGAALARDLASAEPHVTTAWLTVIVGADAFEARVSVPNATGWAFDETTGERTREALLSLGDAPVPLPLVVATVLASRTELACLVPGDAFVFPAAALRPSSNGFLVGAVALVPPRAERGLAADLAEDGRLVVRGLVASHPWDPARKTQEEQRVSSPPTSSPESDMSHVPSSNSTLEVLDDAAVVVRVELGAVEMSARQWAELGAGDVVTLGRKLGAPAVLRVGGVEIAQGELVQVDGEYAVRIVSRTGVER